jgi:pyruvate/2-oxoglutarate dehydrogenase complex dihydrolipoamide dehydrogenase (E3) component
MTNYGLVIVGAGSGNMLPTAGLDGLRVAIIERDRFGGTCLNRGCIPSKMLVYAADVAETVRHAGRYGIRAELGSADWPAIRDRVFARIDPLSEEAVAFRRRSGAEVYLGEARFVAPRCSRSVVSNSAANESCSQSAPGLASPRLSALPRFRSTLRTRSCGSTRCRRPWWLWAAATSRLR